jgi:hypothetical protein
MQKFPICLEYENTLYFTWEWKSGCPCGVFCPSPSPLNTYSYVGKENSDSTRKFVQNYLNWHTKYLNTSTIIRKILSPKKLLSSIRKYVKPKPISHQNQKLTQQHNWKKNSSSPRKPSVLKPLSKILASWFSKIKKPNKYCLGNQTKFLIFLFTDFCLHRKGLIFLRNDRDYNNVDL